MDLSLDLGRQPGLTPEPDLLCRQKCHLHRFVPFGDHTEVRPLGTHGSEDGGKADADGTKDPVTGSVTQQDF